GRLSPTTATPSSSSVASASSRLMGAAGPSGPDTPRVCLPPSRDTSSVHIQRLDRASDRERMLLWDMGLRSIASIIAVLTLAAVAVVPARADQSASEVAGALQQKYDRIKDFSADFVHTYRGGVLNKQITE